MLDVGVLDRDLDDGAELPLDSRNVLAGALDNREAVLGERLSGLAVDGGGGEGSEASEGLGIDRLKGRERPGVDRETRDAGRLLEGPVVLARANIMGAWWDVKQDNMATRG